MFNVSKSIILVALEDELPKKYLPSWNILYTGVGKINASYSASKAIFDFKPETIINKVKNSSPKPFSIHPNPVLCDPIHSYEKIEKTLTTNISCNLSVINK